jgi:hypothetical protein
MHITAKQNTLSISGTKWFDHGSESCLFFGLKLVLNKAFDNTKDAHEHFVNTYFDEMGFSGHYWLLPESRKDFITKEFGYSISNVPEESIIEAVEFGEDTTTIQIVLMERPEDIAEEIEATCSELNEYREAGYIKSFQQYWLY